MEFQEPKVEFVSIELSDVIATSTGGGQYCIASQEDAIPCSDWDTAVPW